MAEWKACEMIVKQREKESHSAIYAKLSSGSSIDSHVQRLIHRDSTISNDVRHLDISYLTIDCINFLFLHDFGKLLFSDFYKCSYNFSNTVYYFV